MIDRSRFIFDFIYFDSEFRTIAQSDTGNSNRVFEVVISGIDPIMRIAHPSDGGNKMAE